MDQRVLGRMRVRSERIRRHAEHIVTDSEPINALADGGHHPGSLDSERHDGVFDSWIQAERLEHVAKIQPGRVHRDLDLAGPGRLTFHWHELQRIQRSGLRYAKLEGAIR